MLYSRSSSKILAQSKQLCASKMCKTLSTPVWWGTTKWLFFQKLLINNTFQDCKYFLCVEHDQRILESIFFFFKKRKYFQGVRAPPIKFVYSGRSKKDKTTLKGGLCNLEKFWWHGVFVRILLWGRVWGQVASWVGFAFCYQGDIKASEAREEGYEKLLLQA